MTKAQRQRLAKRARRYGHFAQDDGTCRVRCPLEGCNAWVTTHSLSFSDSVVCALDAAVLDHFEDEHDGETF